MEPVEFPEAFPKLETESLVLRQLTESDADALFLNYSDEDIAGNFLQAPLSKVLQALQFIAAFNEEFSQGDHQGCGAQRQQCLHWHMQRDAANGRMC